MDPLAGTRLDGVSRALPLRGEGAVPDRTLVVQYDLPQSFHMSCVMRGRWRLLTDVKGRAQGEPELALQVAAPGWTPRDTGTPDHPGFPAGVALPIAAAEVLEIVFHHLTRPSQITVAVNVHREFDGGAAHGERRAGDAFQSREARLDRSR